MRMFFSKVALSPLHNINSLFGLYVHFKMFPKDINSFGLHELGTCFADSIELDLQFCVQNPTMIDMLHLQGLNLNPGISKKGI